MAISKFKLQGVEYSNAAVARELLKGNDFVGITERSLATYLGDLLRGKKRWWEGRQAQLQAVVDLTGYELADLGFSEVAPLQAYAFPTFPALRPLDLANEALPDVFDDVELQKGSSFKTDFWLAPESKHPLDRPQPGIYWLQVPPGHSLDLLWQQLLARGHARCIELDALTRSLPEQVGSKPVVLRVARPLDVDEYGLAKIAPPTPPVLVLSRHRPPLTPEPQSDLPALQLRRLAGLLQPSLCGAMRRDLKPNWQDSLIEWIEARLQTKETLLSKIDLQRWIDDLLPYCSVVSTPDELIALCGVLHQSGHVHRSFPKGAALFRACTSNQDVAKRLEKTLKHRYLHGEIRWDEPLPPDQWAQHLQPGIDDTASISSLVASVVEEKSAARRREAKAKLLTATAESALSQLRDDFGLCRHEDGSYHMRLPFLANVVVADKVFELVESGRVDDLARLYLDPSRRVAVEIALWRRTLDKLIDDTERLLTRSEGSLIQLAAEEALFWAIGLKLSQLKTNIAGPAQDVLHVLAERTIARIAKMSSKPATRDLQTPEEALAWVAVCWHWSIRVKCPPTTSVPNEFAWLFPGWAASEQLVANVTSNLPYESYEALGNPRIQAGRGAWRLWWSAAQNVADYLPEVPQDPPDALLPALVLSCLRKEWLIDASWVRAMHSQGALTPFVRNSIGEIDTQSRKKLLDAILTAMDLRTIAHSAKSDNKYNQHQEQIKAIWLSESWLVQDVIDDLKVSDVIDVAGPSRFTGLIQCLADKNLAIIPELARAIPLQPGWDKVFRQLLPVLPRESWSTAAAWLDQVLTPDIAEWLWSNDANNTLNLLRQANQLNDVAAWHLLHQTPDTHIERVAELLSETQSSSLRQHRSTWALFRLSYHGARLEKLVNELISKEWSIHASKHNESIET